MCTNREVFGGQSRLARAGAEVDLKARRREFVFPAPRLLQSALFRALNDSRDLPVAILFFNILCTVVPAVVVLFVAPPSHLLGAMYLAVNYGIFLTRFLVALLHITEHRCLFRPDYRFLNAITVHLLAPLYGIPSGMYTLHHRVMHHVEDNNQFFDLSSTEPYQRDSLAHFFIYWIRHAVGAWLELLIYAVQRQQYYLFVKCLCTETAYLGAVWLLWRWRPTATLWAFILPYLLSSLALMFGNCVEAMYRSQHIFINPKMPDSAYGIGYNCIASPDNAVTFNDGYHIQHHLNSKTHWSDLPQRFLEGLEEHEQQEAYVFEGIGVFQVGLAVFCGRYKYLLDHIVMPHKPASSEEQEMYVLSLRERLKPVARNKKA